MNPIDEIKSLYYGTTRATIVRDLARAVALLKMLPSEDERERAAVYMDGLSQMKAEWLGGGGSDATARRAHPKTRRPVSGGKTPRSRG
jgi:hypothetical protein